MVEDQEKQTPNKQQCNKRIMPMWVCMWIIFCVVVSVGFSAISLCAVVDTGKTLRYRVDDIQMRLEALVKSHEAHKELILAEVKLSDQRYYECAGGVHELGAELTELNKRMNLIEIWTSNPKR